MEIKREFLRVINLIHIVRVAGSIICHISQQESGTLLTVFRAGDPLTNYCRVLKTNIW